MTRKRRSKNNEETIKTIPKTEADSYYARRWKTNPNCKFIQEVKKIEKEKRLNGEDDC